MCQHGVALLLLLLYASPKRTLLPLIHLCNFFFKNKKKDSAPVHALHLFPDHKTGLKYTQPGYVFVYHKGV
jgi:hypothetical protein